MSHLKKFFIAAVLIAILFAPAILTAFSSLATAQEEEPYINVTVVRSSDQLKAVKTGEPVNITILMIYHSTAPNKKVYALNISWDTNVLKFETTQQLEVYYSANGGWVEVPAVTQPEPDEGYILYRIALSEVTIATNSSNLVMLRVNITFTPIANSSTYTTITVRANTDDGTLERADQIYVDAEKPSVEIQVEGMPFIYTVDNTTVESWITRNNTQITIKIEDDYGVPQPNPSELITLQTESVTLTPDNFSVANCSDTWIEGGKTLSKCWIMSATIKADTEPAKFNVSVEVSDAAGNTGASERSLIYVDSSEPAIVEIEVPADSLGRGYRVLSDVLGDTINVTISDSVYGWTLEEAQQLASLTIGGTAASNPILVEIENLTAPNQFGRYTELKLVYRVQLQNDGVINVSANISDLAGWTTSEQVSDVYVVVTPPALVSLQPVNESYVDYSRVEGAMARINVTEPIIELLGFNALQCSVESSNITNIAISEDSVSGSTAVFSITGDNLLEEGKVGIKVECMDIGGHSLEFTIVYTNDVNPPEITGITIEPSTDVDGTLVTNSTPAIKVNVSDTFPFNLTENPCCTTIEDYLSGNFTEYFSLVSFKEYNNTIELLFEPKSPLPDDSYTLELIVRDNVVYPVEHTSSTIISFVVDTRPPTIELVDAAQVDIGRPAYINGTTVYIAGDATEVELTFSVTDPLLNESSIAVLVNGSILESYQYSGGQLTFTVNVGGSDVLNVTIAASDKIGNTGELTVFIVRDKEPPQISYALRKLAVDGQGGIAGLVLDVSLSDNIAITRNIVTIMVSAGGQSYEITVNLSECSGKILKAYVSTYDSGEWVDVSSVIDYDELDYVAYCGFGKVVLNATKLVMYSGGDTKFTVSLEAEDAVGNSGTVVVGNFTVANVEYTFYLIRLYGGWNLVSLPVVASYDLTELADRLLGGGASLIGAIYEYVNGSWSIPSKLEDGKGYFIYINAPLGALADVMMVDGTKHPIGTGTQPPTTLTYELDKGWNLVGFTTTQSMLASEYFASLGDKLIGVWAWNPESQSWVLIYHIALRDRGLMVPGLGYFIYLSEPGTLIPPLKKAPIEYG